jgi:hypothetical protein
MRVDDLARHGRPSPNMACEASILPVGSRIGEVLLTIPVTADAEVGSLDGTETEAMIVVVARRAQATAAQAGGRIPDKPSPRRRRGGESVSAERRPRSPVAVQRALKPTGEVLAGKRLLVLGLVAAPTLAVADRFREVGMPPRRVALPTTNAPGRVTTVGVVRGGWRRVARHTGLDVGDGPRDRLRVRPRRPGHQEATGGRKTKRGCQETSGAPRHTRFLRGRRAVGYETNVVRERGDPGCAVSPALHLVLAPAATWSPVAACSVGLCQNCTRTIGHHRRRTAMTAEETPEQESARPLGVRIPRPPPSPNRYEMRCRVVHIGRKSGRNRARFHPLADADAYSCGDGGHDHVSQAAASSPQPVTRPTEAS